MATMKTPGVYILEKNAFPNSVVDVATAVPAFIGYTQQAVHAGRSVQNQPVRITSLAEFEQCFGGPPRPRFSVAAAVPQAPVDALGPPGQVTGFRLGQGHFELRQAAGRAGGRYLLAHSMRHFFANGGGPCFVVSVGSYEDEPAPEPLMAGLVPLLEEQEPTLVLSPDAVLLGQADCAAVQQAMVRHCGADMRNRVAILDVWGGAYGRDRPGFDCIEAFRSSVGIHQLDFAVAYTPWLHTSMVQPGEVDTSSFGVGESLQEVCLSLLAQAGEPAEPAAAHALAETLLKLAAEQLNLLPPSAAMAGVYTLVDSTRGVWKAPANVGLARVLRPAVDISHAEQEDLNVSTQGKSINAIRNFVGEGVLVWGARTLDGNSLDWRYVNVRRTVIMLEQSCLLAAQALIFEPNVANTWVTVKAMISNFLFGIWKRGGLAGAVPDDAFSVHVGLGETMTEQDILDGLLVVTVMVALTRPAEFIEITFRQQQKS